MTIFEVIIWAAFGAVLGGFIAFLRSRRLRLDFELMGAGLVGGVLGGIVASLLSPGLLPPLAIGEVDMFSLAGALAVAGVALLLDWQIRGKRTGPPPRA